MTLWLLRILGWSYLGFLAVHAAVALWAPPDPIGAMVVGYAVALLMGRLEFGLLVAPGVGLLLIASRESKRRLQQEER
jgi:hypothetical protein